MLDQPRLRQPEAEAQPRLRIYLLGPASIEWQGQPVNILRRQARALLYRLAAHLQPVPREELCFECWPDTSEATAHRYLSHLLSHVREALPTPDIIQTNNELVALDPDKAWSDAAAFRAACAALDTRNATVLEEAVGLYRGPFLAGFSLPDRAEFELWVAQQRSTFERLYLDALQIMMTAEANQAEWARAVAYGREYLRIDELAEEVHRRLMVLYIMMGDRPSALQQYRTCEGILRRELNVAPLPETRAIYDAIAHGV